VADGLLEKAEKNPASSHELNYKNKIYIWGFGRWVKMRSKLQ
jgi:hypothetical protein